MRHFLDTKLKGHALVFDGPLDLMEHAKKANDVPNPYQRFHCNWPGRVASNWTQAYQFLHTPWPEATFMVKEIADGVRKGELPKPQNIRRRMRWSEEDGEVDVDRAMAGEPDFFRRARREPVFGSSHVALLCNLDTDSNHFTNRTGVFFRSATAIAVSDLLEEAGYTVEMWAWCRGELVYPHPNSNQFVCCRFKEAGEPLDVDACCDTLSDWFTTNAIYGSFVTAPVYPARPPHQTGVVNELGEWAKFMEVTQGVRTVEVPIVYGMGTFSDPSSVTSGIQNGIKAARMVLEEVTKSGGLRDNP